MYLRKGKTKNGRIHLSITQSYRNKNGKPTNKTIRTIGYLDKVAKEWNLSEDEALKRAEEICRDMTDEYNKSNEAEYIKINQYERVDKRTTNVKNLGCAVPLAFYNAFNIEGCIRNLFNTINSKYDANAIMRLLVIERILNPRSRRSAHQNKDNYFFKSDFSETDMSRACQKYPAIKDIIIKKINDYIEKLGYRDNIGNIFYDVTNYYFEIDEQDTLRRLGKGKENTKTPIIQMGLLQDENALPITYKLYPGSTPDYSTMLPILEDLKTNYNLKNITIVADKGNNTSRNIACIHLKENGFIFSQSIRGTKSSQDLKKWVIDDTGYQSVSSSFKIKSKIDEKVVHVKKEDSWDGKEHKVNITIKCVAYWSEKYEKRSRYKRNKQIEKAKRLIDLKTKNVDAQYFKASKYIKDYTLNYKTGEVTDTKRNYELDEDLIKQEEACDGYYCIITNRTDLSDRDIINAYKGLWQIEDTFKISKSDLNVRPIYANSTLGINSHFLICYIALTISRLIQISLNKKYSVRQIVEDLEQCNGINIERNWWFFGHRTDITDKLYELIGIPKQKKSLKLSEIKKYLKKDILANPLHYTKYYKY